MKLECDEADQPRMNIRRIVLIFVVGIITAACSEESDREKDANTAETSRKPVRS